MVEKIERYAKYKILRHRATHRTSVLLTKEEKEILDFVKLTLRTSDSIIISSDVMKATKGNSALSMEHGRLRVVNGVKNHIMDVKVGDIVKTYIKDYAARIIKHRSHIFNKCCSQQISNLINDFQS